MHEEVRGEVQARAGAETGVDTPPTGCPTGHRGPTVSARRLTRPGLAVRGRVAGRRPDRPGHPIRSLMKTAFVLSGGASLGAVQVGMLQALSDAGVVGGLLALAAGRWEPGPPARIRRRFPRTPSQN